jgi:hypothetical protein
MRKILTLFIAFFVLFNASMNLYAFCVDNITLSDFDDFAIEQVQKVFGSNLSEDASNTSKKNDNNSAAADNFLDSNNCDFMWQGVCISNVKNLKMICFLKSNKNLIYDWRDTENKMLSLYDFSGLSEYRIRLNKYIAIIVPNDNLNFINKNFKC